MATSGTTAFNMDFTEIAEEAWSVLAVKCDLDTTSAQLVVP